ncbi:hypothetical protein A2U01_0007182 [Trifolium medium]|uniref:Uncharacterized protein n=1 Tax=Trifolium medium TaxID=97028 RepID=A0A392MFP2_9FABA|nr:hypothetical protein [Trifolium medium]
MYGILCAVSFAAFRIISPNTNFAIFNLALCLFVFILIAFIYYYQNQTFDDAATYASELPLVNGDGNISAPEQLESVAGQPATQHKLDIGGEECVEVPLPPPCMTGFDRDCDVMVDLEGNRVVMMETDAR